MGITLHSNINETLGGWIVEQLGRLAVPYDSVTADGFVFTVEAVGLLWEAFVLTTVACFHVEDWDMEALCANDTKA